MANYIDRSIEVIAALDADEIASTPVGEEIGFGSDFSTHVHRRSSGLHIGLKVPVARPRSHLIETRARGDLTIAALIAEHAPELEAVLPAFIGMVAVTSASGYEPLAVITEDVSEAKQLEVWSQPTSQATVELLRIGFEQYGAFYTVFDRTVLYHSLAFDVDGTERLLDFTPPPISLGQFDKLPGYNTTFEYAYDTKQDWMIEVPADSPLALSLPGSTSTA